MPGDVGKIAFFGSQNILPNTKIIVDRIWETPIDFLKAEIGFEVAAVLRGAPLDIGAVVPQAFDDRRVLVDAGFRAFFGIA